VGRLTRLIRGRFLRFRRELLVVAYAVRHRATPLHLRLAGLALFLYLVTPIDLVPVFVPFFGILDDLLIVPWGLSLVVGRLPAEARTDAEASAARFIDRYVARPLRFLLLLVLALVLLWTALLALLWWLLFR
jgi:uncharacterized membrane protein YkvA (DUF1232 family)